MSVPLTRAKPRTPSRSLTRRPSRGTVGRTISRSTYETPLVAASHRRAVVKRAISSGAATGGLPGQVAYAASKAGLLGMIRTLATEGARHGITANALLPGMIATEQALAMPAPVLERVNAAMPTGRMGEPAEVAHAVAFLASPKAGYITGTTLHVNGGMYMT